MGRRKKSGREGQYFHWRVYNKRRGQDPPDFALVYTSWNQA